MKRAISLFIKYPFYANIILVIILGVGLFSFSSMNRSFFPDITEKFINISVFYPGASPKEMEEGITVRIEEALRGIAGIKEINSTSYENFSSVQIEITGEYDIDETLMEVKNAVDGIPSFPVDAEKPIVNKQRSISRAMFMALTGDVDLLTLKQYANEIEYDLYNSGIMSQISFSGFPDLEISVEISEENLRRYQLTLDEVARAIAQNNLDISGGQIRSDEEELLIRSRYRTVKPEEIEQIIIRGNPDGSYLRISDVGSVAMQFADVNPRGMREVQLRLKPLAYFLGFTQASLTSQVRQGFFGAQAQRLQHQKDELRVWVRYPKSDRINIGQLESMRINTPAGSYPLSELATYTIKRGPVNIKHYNGSQEIRVDANVVSYETPIVPIQEKIETEIVPRLLERYPGIDVAYLGQKKDSDETMAQIKKYFFPAFLLMFLIIILHFKSLSQGAIIVAMIPLAWLGAVWGHGVEGVPVSLLSIWGMLALSGVIINDAVVFLSKYNSLLVEGKKVKDAVFEAGQARFRAIVLTTITTSVGLYPIILEKSFQAQFLIPMAIALAYGVFVGTGFILIFFPVLIMVLNDAKRYAAYVYNRINLWIMQGNHHQEIAPETIKNLSSMPSRESVEIAIIHSKRTID
ncbi:MAG TPA: efflux RND transporter permease subunit [Bacteroidetes bacterium]|nr:efflux RND transporter permease subunit [Bacteroidota bacterium]